MARFIRDTQVDPLQFLDGLMKRFGLGTVFVDPTEPDRDRVNVVYLHRRDTPPAVADFCWKFVEAIWMRLPNETKRFVVPPGYA